VGIEDADNAEALFGLKDEACERSLLLLVEDGVLEPDKRRLGHDGGIGTH